MSVTAATAPLTVMTVNIHKGFTTFNRKFILPELRDAVRKVGADVVFLQEVLGTHEEHGRRYDDWPEAPHYEFLADSIWPQFAYGRNMVYPKGHHGNAVMSKFPIVHYQNHDVSVAGPEKRGLLHCVLSVPGWRRNLHCVCVHLSLHERGRRRQLDAIVERLGEVAARGLPIVVAGDFNDWRQRATRVLAERLGMQEVTAIYGDRPARTFPSLLPVLRLDRIYIRGFSVVEASVHVGAPWSLLSDHLALGAVLKRM